MTGMLVSHVSCATVLAAATLLTGCVRSHVTQAKLAEGLVLVLPGIEEHSGHSAMIREGLESGGVVCAIEIYGWHKGAFGTYYAFDEPAARFRAAALAARVREYRGEHPGKPVVLIGHSGGGAIVVFTAEAMSGEEPLSGVLCIAPALGPEYDLTRALAGCGGHMTVCHARNDLLLWGLTAVGRNFDGTRGRTAGREGFRLPEVASPEKRKAFESLRQIEWKVSMLEQGNWGGHFGWTDPLWVKAALAPIVNEWTTPGGIRPETGCVIP